MAPLKWGPWDVPTYSDIPISLVLNDFILVDLSTATCHCELFIGDCVLCKLTHYGVKGVEYNKLLVLQIICIGVQEMFCHPQQMSVPIETYHQRPSLIQKLLLM